VPPAAKRPSRWLDRTVGVLLGLALGIGVIALFVFEGSEGTIDAPRISGIQGRQGQGQGQGQGQAGGGQRVQLVRVIDGKPPTSGPVRVDFEQGEKARFLVDSNEAIGIEISGYGVSRTVGPGRTLVSFKAKKSGQYPIIDAASTIDVATLRVTPR
jgi:hypothetical protein